MNNRTGMIFYDENILVSLIFLLQGGQPVRAGTVCAQEDCEPFLAQFSTMAVFIFMN